MTNPWDAPPLPSRGDSDKNETYAGVGRVISAWENIEFALARLYSVYIGAPDDIHGLRAYGTGRIFRDRLAVESKEVVHPS